MGSDGKPFNVSPLVRGKVSKDRVHKPRLLKRQGRAEAESNALPLGRTGVYSVMSVTSFSMVRSHKGGIRLRELYALTIVCQRVQSGVCPLK